MLKRRQNPGNPKTQKNTGDRTIILNKKQPHGMFLIRRNFNKTTEKSKLRIPINKIGEIITNQKRYLGRPVRVKSNKRI